MERIHRPDSRPWILAGSVKINELIETWAQNQVMSELNINEHNLKDFVKSELQIDDQMMILLEKDSDVSNLDCEGDDEELYVAYEKTFEVPSNVNLETLRLQKQHIERYAIDRCYRTACLQSLRYRNQLIRVDKNTHSDVDSITSIERPIAIITVQLYRPIRFSTHFGNTHRYSFVCDQELEVLSSQWLTELRDTLTCVSDISNASDCSLNPKVALTQTAADVYKSGLFFINNTFYNDMRNRFNRDYSEPIIEWAKNQERGIGTFEKKLMEETKLSDLEIQLGYPYLYQHQGDCEHILVFSDIRLLKPCVDSMDPKDYPKIVSTNRRTQVRCGICNLNTAKWITFDNQRLPENPFFFCETCFYSFNYDNNDMKVNPFKAYPYLDKSALL
ncbi:snRNA-activating protein complex subunit 3-like [Oppia nitens]|uniref:snRNA-activating protein complex subunit 3-like n=1 Tax=Oppia nitens TaxID=1686743 RepID=UPI0023DB3287|nr:snRNA-activating protein complex subunit 3-like [Oppia nitens]